MKVGMLDIRCKTVAIYFPKDSDKLPFLLGNATTNSLPNGNRSGASFPAMLLGRIPLVNKGLTYNLRVKELPAKKRRRAECEDAVPKSLEVGEISDDSSSRASKRRKTEEKSDAEKKYIFWNNKKNVNFCAKSFGMTGFYRIDHVDPKVVSNVRRFYVENVISVDFSPLEPAVFELSKAPSSQKNTSFKCFTGEERDIITISTSLYNGYRPLGRGRGIQPWYFMEGSKRCSFSFGDGIRRWLEKNPDPFTAESFDWNVLERLVSNDRGVLENLAEGVYTLTGMRIRGLESRSTAYRVDIMKMLSSIQSSFPGKVFDYRYDPLSGISETRHTTASSSSSSSSSSSLLNPRDIFYRRYLVPFLKIQNLYWLLKLCPHFFFDPKKSKREDGKTGTVIKDDDFDFNSNLRFFDIDNVDYFTDSTAHFPSVSTASALEKIVLGVKTGDHKVDSESKNILSICLETSKVFGEKCSKYGNDYSCVLPSSSIASSEKDVSDGEGYTQIQNIVGKMTSFDRMEEYDSRRDSKAPFWSYPHNAFLLPPILQVRSPSGSMWYESSEQFLAKRTSLKCMMDLFACFKFSTFPPKVESVSSGLSKDQTSVMKSIDEYSITLALGGPGSGKSHLIGEAIKKYGAEKVYVLSFTGAVTSHLSSRFRTENASTIYRAFQTSRVRRKNKKNIDPGKRDVSLDSKKPEIVIVDEFPMIDNVNFAMALSVFQKTQRRVLLLGDENQIKPIGVGRPMDSLITFWKNISTSNLEDKKRMINVVRFNPENNFRIGANVSSSLLGEIISKYVKSDFMDIASRFYKVGNVKIEEDTVEEFSVVPFEPIIVSEHDDNEFGARREEEEGREKISRMIEKTWKPPGIPNWVGKYSDVQFLCLERKPCKLINDSCDKLAIFDIHGISSSALEMESHKKLFYVGQKITIELRNLVMGSKGIFNGEMYVVKEILATPRDGKQREEEEKTKAERQVDISKPEFGVGTYSACIFRVDGSVTCYRADGKHTLGFEKTYVNPKTVFFKLSRTSERGDMNRTVKISAEGHEKGEQGLSDGVDPVFSLSLEQMSSGWAITVNKSQGSEYDMVCFCILFAGEETHFSKGHGLVALSRSKKKIIFVGKGDLSPLVHLSEKEEDYKHHNHLASNFDFYLDSCFSG